MATTAELFEVGPGARRAAAGEGRGRTPGLARVAGAEVLAAGAQAGRAGSSARILAPSGAPGATAAGALGNLSPWTARQAGSGTGSLPAYRTG